MSEPEKPKNYIVHKDKVYEEKDNNLYSTFTLLNVPKGDPQPIWKGDKIPFSMWQELVAWCQVTQKAFKSEALAFLYYDQNSKNATNRWSYWIPPQETNGMTVSADPDDPRYNKERAGYPDLQFGTLHHHCTTGAFQSGTDLNDEEDREGLHFTIGKVGSKKHDLHARFCIEGKSYTINVADVIEEPKWAEEVPGKYIKTIMKDLLTDPETSLTEWEVWFVADLKKVSRPKAVAHRAYGIDCRNGNRDEDFWTQTGKNDRSREIYSSWEDYKTKQTTSLNESKKKTKVK